MLNEITVASSPAVTAVKLVDSGGPALLFSTRRGATTVLVLRPLAGAEDSARELMPLFAPERPAWDAQPTAGGAVIAAYTEPGSSLCAIGLATSGQAERTEVTAHYPLDVFGAPRFVKGEAGPHPSIVTLALADGDSKVVLFTPQADGGYGEYRVLDTGKAAPQQPMALRTPAGYVLLYKQFATGLGASRENRASHSTITAGPLLAQRLDASWQPAGPAIQLLASPIYQFDAALAGGRLLLFATTAKGYLLAVGGVDDKPTDLSVSEYRWTEPLFSPSLIPGPAGLHLAALQAPGTNAAKVLAGKR